MLSTSPKRNLRAVAAIACAASFRAVRFVALLALAAVPSSHAAVCSLDIDGNGRLEATTDGLLMTRYLLGVRGAALVSGALGAGATRTLPADIENYLATPCAQVGWVGQGSGRLNDTGITFGGEPLSGNNPGCTSSGANIAQQDCSKGRDANPSLNGAADGVAGFSFTKISNAGAALPATATLGSAASDWACTYDNVTRLMWEIKTATGRRSSAHTYSWFSTDASNNAGATGTANGGTCGMPSRWSSRYAAFRVITNTLRVTINASIDFLKPPVSGSR